MKKSKAIIILLCALLVLLGVGYVDLYGVDAEGTASASDISLGLDLAGGVSITYQVVGDEEPDATDMADTIAKLQKRVENYSKEAIVYQEGTDRINIEIPGVTGQQDPGRAGTSWFPVFHCRDRQGRQCELLYAGSDRCTGQCKLCVRSE